MPNLLKFGLGNKKVGLTTWTLTLPAGYSCPDAEICLSKADRKTGKITDGKKTKVRCYEASMEALFPNLRNSNWYNFELLKKCGSEEQFEQLILDSLPEKKAVYRLHVGGDFFSKRYMKGWIRAAVRRPLSSFYGYTKRIELLLELRDSFPENFRLVASLGGKFDRLIMKYGLRHARIVHSEAEARFYGLEIDHDDSHAAFGNENFALLVHGTQPAIADLDLVEITL